MSTTTGRHQNLTLTRRHRALLAAVAAGRAQITCSRAPDLYVDGLCCTDHTAATDLAHHGLVEPTTAGATGQLVPAALTTAGHAALTGQATGGTVVDVRPPAYTSAGADLVGRTA